jgi:hypothetical protein
MVYTSKLYSFHNAREPQSASQSNFFSSNYVVFLSTILAVICLVELSDFTFDFHQKEQQNENEKIKKPSKARQSDVKRNENPPIRVYYTIPPLILANNATDKTISCHRRDHGFHFRWSPSNAILYLSLYIYTTALAYEREMK